MYSILSVNELPPPFASCSSVKRAKHGPAVRQISYAHKRIHARHANQSTKAQNSEYPSPYLPSPSPLSYPPLLAARRVYTLPCVFCRHSSGKNKRNDGKRRREQKRSRLEFFLIFLGEWIVGGEVDGDGDGDTR